MENCPTCHIFCSHFGFWEFLKYLLLKWNTMENKKEENVFSPKGFFMKLEWYELFATMKPKQFQTIMLNSYNYLLGNELLEMNQFELTIFEYAIKPVLVHNNKVYQEKCAHNARISKKGVEAKAAKKLKVETDLTQNNPMGNLSNPELPKDKSRNKEKDIIKSKEEFKTEIKSEDKVEIKVPAESSIIDKDFEVLNKFKELVKIDSRILEEKDDARFVSECKILAMDAGWYGFFQLVLKSSLVELPELIKIHKTSLDEYSIREIRKHHIFYLNKLLK